MKVLLDECVPRRLGRLLEAHECRTVQEMGWAGKKNGELLSLAEGKIDVIVTADQGMEFEQKIAGREIAVLVLAARSNQMEDLAPLVPSALAALRDVRPGSLIRIE